MRRVSVRLLIAVGTFVLGFAAAMLCLPPLHSVAIETVPPPPNCDSKLFPDANPDVSAASADLPILSHCELVNNPERYNGKIVRVYTRLSGFIHGMVMADEMCPGIDNQVAASYNPKTAEEIERILSIARKSKNTMNWLIPVNIIAIGKFEKVTPSNKTDSVYDTSPLRFEIIRVEKVSKLSSVLK